MSQPRPNRVARWIAPVSPEAVLNVILSNGEGLTPVDVEDVSGNQHSLSPQIFQAQTFRTDV